MDNDKKTFFDQVKGTCNEQFILRAEGGDDKYNLGQLVEIFKNCHKDITFIGLDESVQAKVYCMERIVEPPFDPETIRNVLLTKKSSEEMRFFDFSFNALDIDKTYITLSIKDEDLDLLVDFLQYGITILVEKGNEGIFFECDIEKINHECTHKIPLRLILYSNSEEVILVICNKSKRVVYGSYLTHDDIDDILSSISEFNSGRDSIII